MGIEYIIKATFKARELSADLTGLMELLVLWRHWLIHITLLFCLTNYYVQGTEIQSQKGLLSALLDQFFFIGKGRDWQESARKWEFQETMAIWVRWGEGDSEIALLDKWVLSRGRKLHLRRGGDTISSTGCMTEGEEGDFHKGTGLCGFFIAAEAVDTVQGQWGFHTGGFPTNSVP